MNHIFASIPLIGFLLSGATGIFVFARDPAARQNRLFYAFSICIAFFCFFYFLMVVSFSPVTASVFQRVATIFWQLGIVLLLHFSIVITRNESALSNRIVLPLVYFSALFLGYISWITDWFYLTPVKTHWGFTPVFGNYHLWLGLFASLIFLAMVGLLSRKWGQTKNLRERKQFLWVLMGLGIAFVISFLGDVVLVQLGLFFQSLVPVASIVFVLFLGIAMLRYGLMVLTPVHFIREILNTMPEFFVFIDISGTIYFFNQQTLNNLGYSENELRKLRLEQILDDPRAEQLRENICKVGIVSQHRTRLKKKNGDVFPVTMDATVVRDKKGSGVGCVIIFSDISHQEKMLEQQKSTIKELDISRKVTLNMLEKAEKARDEATQSREEIKKLYEDLKVADRIKSEFLSVISHELRTPITPIMGYATLFLQEKYGKIDPAYKKFAEIIKVQSGHLMALIDSILDISRLERGMTFDLKKEPILVSKIINDLIMVFRPQFESRQITVEIDLPQSFPTILADQVKLRRIITNVLSNSIKFTPREGKIRIEGKTEKDNLLLRVIDSGIGIAKENLEKIFDKFYQVDSSYIRAAGGVGLGLTIAREIVKAHGGDMWAESEGLGKGCTIAFTLPLEK